MAKLAQHPAPGHWKLAKGGTSIMCADVSQDGEVTFPALQCAKWDQHSVREGQSVADLPAERVWRTTIADGYASYFVVSEKPLVMAHIPDGDAYRALPATIRGLTLQEVKQDIAWDLRSLKMFRKHRENQENNPEPNPERPTLVNRAIPVRVQAETSPASENARYSARLLQPREPLDAVGSGDTPERTINQLKAELYTALKEGHVSVNPPLRAWDQNVTAILTREQSDHLVQEEE